MNKPFQRFLGIGITLSTLAFGAGCAVQGYAPSESVDESIAAIVGNDTELNGGGVNGGGVNGGGVNGGGVNGTPLSPDADITHFAFNLSTISHVTMGGKSGNSASLRKKFRNAITHHEDHHGLGHHDDDDGNGDCDDDDDDTHNDASLLDAEVTGKLSNAGTVSLRFDAEESFTSATGDTMSRYVVSFEQPGREGRAYVCGLHDGVPVKVIPIAGKWNFAQGVPGGGSKSSNAKWITFACQGYALYKCVDYGYPTWKKVDGVSLEPYHQACTRMIRADYCGDGTPYTIDGTLINLYDKLGIQTDTENWRFEAEWNTDGARCVSHERIANLGRSPECVFARASQTCGNPIDWTNTLIVNESQ